MKKERDAGFSRKRGGDAGFSRKRGGNAGLGPPLPDPELSAFGDLLYPVLLFQLP